MSDLVATWWGAFKTQKQPFDKTKQDNNDPDCCHHQDHLDNLC